MLSHALEGTDLGIRRAGEADIPELARLYSQMFPIDEQAPDVFGPRWRDTRPGFTADYYMVEAGQRAVGALYVDHAPWELDPERFAYVSVILPGDAMSPERFHAAQVHVEAEAIAQGAHKLMTDFMEDREDIARLLSEMGWERDRLAKAWELDLVANRDQLLASVLATRAAMVEQGIRMTTIALDAERDPEAMRKLHALHQLAVQDMPHSEPIIPQEFEHWMKRWAYPDLHRDRFWIAKDGDRTVAASFLRFPPTAGPVWTGFTATVGEYRGRGIARAVKMESLAQAIELGVPIVRTDNDETNASMLHINETLGYRRIPGWLQFKKDVETLGAAPS